MDKKPIIELQKNGPYIVRNVEKVIDSDGKQLGKKQERMLCRCGATGYQPFCDGSHITIGYTDQAENQVNENQIDQTRENNNKTNLEIKPEIVIEANGPYHVKGRIDLKFCESGKELTIRQDTLCRCGGSKTKPFCDGTHKKNGFRDDHLLAIARIDTLSDDLTRISISKKELVIVKQPGGISVFCGICLHEAALLANGFLEENHLVCGRHRWRYDLESGKLDGDPSMSLKKLNTSCENGWILIEHTELDELEELDDD